MSSELGGERCAGTDDGHGMTQLNAGMLLLAGLSILIFVGLFILFRIRYRLMPQVTSMAPPVVPTRTAPVYTAWRLVERTLLNPDSERRGAWRVRFESEGPMPAWVAGATAQVYPGTVDGRLDRDRPVRAFPIASLPSEGGIELIVRDEGEASSNWLCIGLQPGQRAALAINYDPDDALPADSTPLIVIGNGVGVGGLRAYVKARPVGTRNWMIFGEHSSAHDMLIGTEIADWVATGHLERCDMVFARDMPDRGHVSDQIRAAADPLFDWVLADAAIYVCGRQAGFAADVEAALADVLGADVLTALEPVGLYRQQTY